MAERRAFKPDSSFFRMLAVGAVGARAVQATLNARGHDLVELERGSLSTRVWKDVKRKRVRIPDLCCTRCGVRVESRAKTTPGLVMSHSPGEAERAWDYGMLDGDWVAFPVLRAAEDRWGEGHLQEPRSLWRECTRTSWAPLGSTNVFLVGELRSVAPRMEGRKGVTEGSEIQASWRVRFAESDGYVTLVRDGRLCYRDAGSERERHFRLGTDERPFVAAGEVFAQNQVVAGLVRPLAGDELGCASVCGEREVERMLGSRERTVRFTACKLARARRWSGLQQPIRDLSRDPEEDLYVQMEARAYLCDAAGDAADDQFGEMLLLHPDHQMRLEAAVVLSEIRSRSAFGLLLSALEDTRQPLFLRSACAWALGCHGSEQAAEALVRCFADVSREIREEALASLVALGGASVAPLVRGLALPPDVAAGSAEALRRLRDVPVQEIAGLADLPGSVWPTWVLAHLPKESVIPSIAALQTRRPEVHFAITVLWTFLESWIAENWTPRATP